MAPSKRTLLMTTLLTSTASMTHATTTSYLAGNCTATCDPTEYPPQNLAMLDNFFACEANSQEYVGYSTQILPTSTNSQSWAQTEIKRFVANGNDQQMDFSWVQTAGGQYCGAMSLKTSAVAMNKTMQAYQYASCHSSPLPCITEVNQAYLGVALVTPDQSTVCPPENALTEQIYTSAQMNVPTYDQGNVDVEPIIGAGITSTPVGFFDLSVPIQVGRCDGACQPTCLQYNGTSCQWETSGIYTQYTAGQCTVTCQLTRPGDLIYGGLVTVINGSPLKPATPQTVPTQAPGSGTEVVIIIGGGGKNTTTSNATAQTPIPCPSNAIAIELTLVGSGITPALCGSQQTGFNEQFLQDLATLTGAPASQFLILYTSFDDFTSSLSVFVAVYETSSTTTQSMAQKRLTFKSLAATQAMSNQDIINGLYDNNADSASNTVYGQHIDFQATKQQCSNGPYSGTYSSACLVANNPSVRIGLTSASQIATTNVQPAWVWGVIAMLAAICAAGIATTAFFYYHNKKQQKLMMEELAATKNAQLSQPIMVEDSQVGMRIPVGEQPHNTTDGETQPFSPSSYIPAGWQAKTLASPQSTNTIASEQVEGEMNAKHADINSTAQSEDVVNINFEPLSTRSRGFTTSAVRVKTSISQKQ